MGIFGENRVYKTIIREPFANDLAHVFAGVYIKFEIHIFAPPPSWFIFFPQLKYIIMRGCAAQAKKKFGFFLQFFIAFYHFCYPIDLVLLFFWCLFILVSECPLHEVYEMQLDFLQVQKYKLITRYLLKIPWFPQDKIPSVISLLI